VPRRLSLLKTLVRSGKRAVVTLIGLLGQTLLQKRRTMSI
jgi:hypothetical protein